MSRNAGIAWLLLIACALGTNHVAARLAFDHGVSVPTAVLVRSLVAAAFVLVLIRQAGVPLALPRRTVLRGMAIGVLVAVQSLCLSSAVSRMPVALALLVFNTFPIVLGLLSWISGGERPGRRTWIAMPIALLGLALALGGRQGAFAAGGIPASAMSGGHAPATGSAPAFATSGAAATAAAPDYLGGSLLAFGASLAFASVLLLTTRWLSTLDGRLRSLLLMSTAAASTLLIGGLAGSFRAPHDTPGWLGLAILATLYASAMTALFTVLPRLGAVNNAAVLNVEPIAALGMGWLVLGQTVAPIQLVGAALVVGAIVMLSAGHTR